MVVVVLHSSAVAVTDIREWSIPFCWSLTGYEVCSVSPCMQALCVLEKKKVTSFYQ
jgi:hypothetical protein